MDDTRQLPNVDEVGEFITTLVATPPHRMTACRGWTAHELVAHLAAGASEEATLIEAHLAGEPERATRGHEEREAPLRELPDPQLRDRLLAESARLSAALDRLGNAGTSVVFTGRAMTAGDFAMHSRSECSLHRWDLVGRDDVGWSMLGQPKLTTHALTVLSAMATLPEAPGTRLAASPDLPAVRAVVRSEPHDDLVIAVSDGAVELSLAPITDEPADVETDPASRLLLLWDRREPSAPVDVHATGPVRHVLATLFPL